MFKLLMTFVLMGFGMLLVYAIYNILQSKFPDKDLRTKEESSIDSLIKELKIAIALAEVRASNGQKEAEAELLQYKADLKKAEELKEKTKNL